VHANGEVWDYREELRQSMKDAEEARRVETAEIPCRNSHSLRKPVIPSRSNH